MTPNSFFREHAARMQRLGAGCFGTVLALADDLAVKVSANDGTRTYLEWCMWRQREGKALPGMPRVLMVVDVADIEPNDNSMKQSRHGYMAIMQRMICCTGDAYLSRDNDVKAFHEGLHTKGRSVYRLLKPLRDAFYEETGLYANDCHGGNMMYGRDESGNIAAYITDPSSKAYVKPKDWPCRKSMAQVVAEPAKATCSLPQKLPEDHPARAKGFDIRKLPPVGKHVDMAMFDELMKRDMMNDAMRWHGRWKVHNGIGPKPVGMGAIADQAVPILNETAHDFSAPDAPAVLRHKDYVGIMEELRFRPERMPDPRLWAPGLWKRPDHLRLDAKWNGAINMAGGP